MGPTALYDKSFLQCLSTDEAVWFDHYFLAVVCPIFYVETLADLAKEPSSGRSAEALVTDIANKFPEMGGSPCGFHNDTAIANLLGHDVVMDGRVPRPGARRSKSGVLYEPSPEDLAFSRWRAGRFEEVERLNAAYWRRKVNQFDLEAIAKELRDLGINGKSCKSLEEACDFSREIMHGKHNPHARLAFAVSFFQVPKHLHSGIVERWNALGQPTLNTFAPYASFVLTIEVFFRIALAAHLIATERPSNQNDIAYLFYLPFCNVFVSSDRLHRRCAKLFMRPNQQFIWGPELKGALSEANSHFLNLPELERERGVIGFPHPLPKENLIERLWPRNARGRLEKPSSDQSKAELHAELTKRLQQMRGEPVLHSNDPAALEQADTLTIERKVRRKRGSWWQVPKDPAG